MMGLIKSYLTTGNAEWAIRRRLVVLIVFFCFGVIIWSLGWIPSDSRSENATNQAFMILMAVITIYIGGVVTDDFLKAKVEANKNIETKTVETKTVETQKKVEDPTGPKPGDTVQLKGD